MKGIDEHLIIHKSENHKSEKKGKFIDVLLAGLVADFCQDMQLPPRPTSRHRYQDKL